MRFRFSDISQAVPFIVIGSLLYAGLFVKPEQTAPVVADSIFERGDKFYGAAADLGGDYWLAGTHGKVIITRENGKRAIKRNIKALTNIQDVSLWDEKRAIVVGDGPIVMFTDDGGENWKSADFTNDSIATKFIRVYAIDGGDAYVVGEGGVVLKCTTFGMRCNRISNVEDIAWNDISFNNGNLVTVGEFGNIRYLSSSEKTWQASKSPTTTSLMAVAFKNYTHGVAVGLNGILITTEDAGKTWKAQRSVTREHILSIAWDGNRYIAAGEKGVVLIGNSNGDLWTVRKLDNDDQSWYTKVVLIGDSYLMSGSKVSIVKKDNL